MLPVLHFDLQQSLQHTQFLSEIISSQIKKLIKVNCKLFNTKTQVCETLMIGTTANCCLCYTDDLSVIII